MNVRQYEPYKCKQRTFFARLVLCFYTTLAQKKSTQKMPLLQALYLKHMRYLFLIFLAFLSACTNLKPCIRNDGEANLVSYRSWKFENHQGVDLISEFSSACSTSYSVSLGFTQEEPFKYYLEEGNNRKLYYEADNITGEKVLMRPIKATVKLELIKNNTLIETNIRKITVSPSLIAMGINHIPKSYVFKEGIRYKIRISIDSEDLFFSRYKFLSVGVQSYRIID